MADGDKVLDILANHPGTGRFIARKLLQRFGIENPSDRYLDAVATAFSQNSDAADQIAQVLQVLILDVEFATTPPTKMRRPFEFLVALYRAAGARVASPTRDFDWHLTRAGWTQHAVRPPTGHSDQTLDWANTRTLNGLVGLALYAHEDWMGVQSGESALIREAQTIGDLARVADVRFGLAAGTTSAGFAALGIGLNDQMPKDPGERTWLVSISQACAALTPAFILR
jgi:uncharacterized protein (DUF1800 family)